MHIDSLLTVFGVGRLDGKQPSWRKCLSSLLGLLELVTLTWRKLTFHVTCPLASHTAIVSRWPLPGRTYWVNNSVRTWWKIGKLEIHRKKCLLLYPPFEADRMKKACADVHIFQGTGKSSTPIQNLPYSLLVFCCSFRDGGMPPFCTF